MKLRLSKFVVLAALSVLPALAGCAGRIEETTGTGGTGGEQCVPQGGTTTPPATFATITEMFQMGSGSVESCISAACHGDNGIAPPPPRQLSLQAGPNLYNTMMTYLSPGCADMPLVKKGKPDESALVKILGEGACGPGSYRMPFGCDINAAEFCMPNDYMMAIRQWIANCAPP